MAELANAIQSFFIEEIRLGISVILHKECLHDLIAPEATNYPQPIGFAATFNNRLVEEIYSAVARDNCYGDAQQALTPDAEIVRNVRWGRDEGTYDEDPSLIT